MSVHGPVRARLPDGRVHFQHGPIDLVIGADGDASAVAAALDDCWRRFDGLLAGLVAELAVLRSDCAAGVAPRGPVARRMWRACVPFSQRFGVFITPMAAVAGSVADELIGCFARDGIRRAYVNNGGDIAVHLAGDARYAVGVVADVDAPQVGATLALHAAGPDRGIATSGWRGRSFSLGIADAVTVVARDAAAADAAATMIANRVDVDDPAIVRAPACSLRDDTDLGERLVTAFVPALSRACVERALEAGERHARTCIGLGLASQVLLSLQGASRIVSAVAPVACGPSSGCEASARGRERATLRLGS